MKQRIGLGTVVACVAWSAVSVAQAPPSTPPPAAPPPAAPPPAAPPPAAPAAPPSASPPAAPSAPAPAAPPPAAPAPAAPPSAEAPVAPPAESPAAPPPEAAPPTEPPAPSPVPAPEAVAEPPAPGEPPVEEAPAADDTAATDAEEIVVTGSRVRRTSFSASAPVQTIDRREIEYSGATNMADLIQHLTVSSGSGFQGSAGSFPGTPHLNLRGLGSGRTLVLLNGRRMPYSASGIEEHYADIGTIPLAAVERVEVLKGGASAIYGSDAIAGVVNIITRKDWDGARIELNGQTTEEFDQQEGTGSLAIGATSERSRVSAAVNYFRSTELTAGERDFTRGPPSDWRGYRQSEELKDALMSQGVSILGNPGAFGAPVPAADPRCAMAQGSAPFDTVVRGTIPAQFCGFDFRPYSSLSPAVERVTTYGYGEYDLTHHTTAFAELNVSRMRGDNVYSPSFPILAFPTVPAGHVDNPAGADQTFYGRALGAEAGGARSTFGDDTVRGVLGLKGDFEDAASGSLAEDWEWEIYASLGVSRYNLQVPDTLAARFGDALAACSDPADLNGCFNPYYSSVTGSGTPNSNAVIDSFSGRLNNITDHWLHTYSAGLNGPILELPGGDLAFALGGELRREMRTVEIDHDSNVFAYNFLLGNSDADADRHVVAGYLELVWPFYDGVEVQTAGRIENYSDVGLTANPTLGLLLTPAEIAGSENVSDAFKRLQLRGHLASAFRAPTIIQTFPGSATVPDQFSSMGNTYYLPVHYHGNPNLDHEQAITVSGGFGWNIVRPITLEADYWHYDYDGRISVENPQVVFATQRSAVELFDPPLQPVVFSDADPTLPSRVNASQVNIDGSVIMDGIDFGAWVKLDEEEFGVDVGTFRFGAGGTYTLLYEIPRFERVGADEVPTVFVQTDPDGDGNAEPVDPENCDAETCDVVGQLNLGNLTGSAIPALKMNFPVSWAYDGHMIVFTGHYIGPMKDDEHYDIDTGAYNEVDAIVTFDAQYGYTIDDWIGEALTLRVGVYNLFDQDPPFVDDLTGFAPTTHDPRGRMFYAKMIGEF